MLGFALFHRFDYSSVFIGASALLVLSFIFAFPVGEPKRPLTERYTAERWIDNLMVKESLDPAIGVAFFPSATPASSRSCRFTL